MIPELLKLEPVGQLLACGTQGTLCQLWISELLDAGTSKDSFWHVAHGTHKVDTGVAGCWSRLGQLLACGTRGTLSQLWISELLDAGTGRDGFWRVAHGIHKVDTGVADVVTGRGSFWRVAHGAH